MDISLADIDALLNVNVRAPFIASKAALAHLVNGGRIITIADRVPTPILSAYAATKSALAAFTNVAARELGPKEVTVNLVPPGSIDTDMFPANGPHTETAKQLTALGRYGAPEDIANAAAVPGVREGSIHTGSTLTVDGGANA